MNKCKVFVVMLLIMLLGPLQAIAVEDGFNPSVTWNGSNIIVKYSGYDSGIISSGVTMTITNNSTGKSWTAKSFSKTFNKPVTGIKLQTNDKVTSPKKDETWQVQFDYGGKSPITVPVDCSRPDSNEAGIIGDATDEGNWQSGPIPIFPGESQKVVMFWYYSLATLSGAFMFLVFIKSGYQHIFSLSSNPGVKASAILTLQRGFVGLIIIMLAPFFVNILIAINDSFVDFCRQLLETAAAASPLGMEETPYIASENSLLDNIFAWVFCGLNNIINQVLGLTPLGDVIFNQTPAGTILSNNIINGDFVNTGNPFADALLRLGLLGFSVYFNAVYVIRRWVVIAVMAVTPIIVWIWVVSDNKQIIGLWLAELVQTVFMQSFHALTFGIVFSVLAFSGGSLSPITGEQVSALLIGVGKYIAAFGGIACVSVLIVQAYRIILNSNEKERSEALSNIKSALIGVVILGLSYMLASALFPHEITIFSQGQIDAGGTLVDVGPSGDGTNRISIFYLFFALVAILPIAKMLSNIFMNIIARFGTVDEMRTAASGLGALSGLAMLGGAAASGLGKIYSGNGSSGGSDGGSGGGSGPGGGSDGGSGPGGGSGGSGGGGGSGGSGGGANSDHLIPYDNSTSSGGQTPSSPSGSVESVHEGMPNTYQEYEIPSGTSGYGDMGGGDDETAAVDPSLVDPDFHIGSEEPTQEARQEAGQKFDDIVQKSTDKMNTISKNSAKVGKDFGAASSFAIPGAGAGIGGLFGGMAFGAVKAATPLAVGATLYKASQEAGGFAALTGRRTESGGVMQAGAAALLSPLSPGFAQKVSPVMGSYIDKIDQAMHLPPLS